VDKNDPNEQPEVAMQEGVYEEFTKTVAEKVAKFNLGNGLEKGTTLGPLINAKAVDRVNTPFSFTPPLGLIPHRVMATFQDTETVGE
jgi:hypothetical protein